MAGFSRGTALGIAAIAAAPDAAATVPSPHNNPAHVSKMDPTPPPAEAWASGLNRVPGELFPGKILLQQKENPPIDPDALEILDATWAGRKTNCDELLKAGDKKTEVLKAFDAALLAMSTEKGGGGGKAWDVIDANKVVIGKLKTTLEDPTQYDKDDKNKLDTVFKGMQESNQRLITKYGERPPKN